ncbi:CD3337/EF1877 family mobilome membrane protein [Thomasclavelia ramosa]|uniref:CD3337/EF1877 family mobilome membrane protein n=1 Tax=Thomasclavelia ramosa TaxID=1547 RepID=UPI001C2B986F|nr:YtxH domain-containing protein [Thomasclavelia ramosa]MBU9904763.1 YtxH domain-containing protein [Thomasclavelia ramosa]MBV4086446.1 YtxH domain-containing protein [Thomasclavelia ramosa]MBV4094692.1 YtxH domain-containing protein [Thomasclavelia ramosa]MBV4109289.1 YtxH domain-containing protein [Thomasclavelia ramosa]MBV4112463.1 YtxH domain-containing protein [Thomasclavelia ramosa]
MRKRKILRFFGIALLVVFGVLAFLSITGTVAHAAGLVDTTVNDANAYSKYPLENYQLDFYVDSSWDWLPWNWLDGIGKSIQYGLYAITNFIWTVSLYISNATGYVVQEAYKLDFISDTANSIGKNIQTLAGVTKSGFSSEGFYVGFLLILILVTGIYIAYTGLIKRETTKAVHAVVNFLVVFILSASFIAYAPNYISKINDFSSDISSSALSLGTKIVLPDSSSKGKDSVDLIRDSLFSIQVKQPWLLLQYGESDMDELGSDRVESLLSESPDTDDREDIVIEEIEDKDNDNLSVTKTMTRLGMVVFLFIFNIGISVFVFLLTGMMIFSQVLFIIYAMFLPVSFILSMIPTYEGMAKKAVTKLFNTIMMRAGISLIITTAFSISTMFYSISSGYPFFMVAFLQIVTFAGIYFKLGDLMAMFSLQSSDTQQVSRRIMRRPYLFLNRGARRLERKIGRTVAAGAAGGLVGAAAVSQSRKTDNPKPAGSGHSRPNHDTSMDTSSFGKRAGAKVGAVLDGKERMKDKAKSVGQQVKDMPTQVQYALHSGVNQIQENVSDFKRGIVEEKATRKQGRADKQEKHRQTIAQKRMAMDKSKQSNGSATKGAAPLHERPVTTPVPAKTAPQAAVSKGAQTIKERPTTTAKEQPPVKSKEPVTRVQEVRTQAVRESTALVRQQTSQAAADTARQTVQRHKQTQNVQKKQKNKTTVNKTTSRKGGKR